MATRVRYRVASKASDYRLPSGITYPRLKFEEAKISYPRLDCLAKTVFATLYLGKVTTL